MMLKIQRISSSISSDACDGVCIKDYAKQVYESYLRRKLIYLGEDLIAKAEIVNLENSIVNQIESAEQNYSNLQQIVIMNKIA